MPNKPAKKVGAPMSKAMQRTMKRMETNLKSCVAVEVTSNNHLPTYKNGDVLILLDAKVEARDHVVVTRKDGKACVAALCQKTKRDVILMGVGIQHKLETVKMKDIEKISRVASVIHA